MEINDLLKNPEQIKGLIALLQTLVQNQEEPEPQPKKSRGSSSVKKIKEKPGRENKFLDMPEKNLHKEDTEIDKKLHKLPPTPRSRKFRSIKATCRVCGRSDSVNPGYITTELDRYKCNKCAGAAG